MLSALIIPVSAESENDFTVKVSDTAATAGDSRVAVDILLENNPGFAGFSFCVNYDIEKLVLAESEICIEDGYQVITQTADGNLNLAWTDTAGYAQDGKIATLYFNIPKDAQAEDVAIEVLFRDGYDSFYMADETDLAVKTKSGKLTVTALPAGDKSALTAGTAVAEPEATDIIIPIMVENNPGFSGFSFCVNFDDSRLILKKAEILLDDGYQVISHPEGYGVNIAWTSTQAYTGNGTIAQLHFALPENIKFGKAYVDICWREGYDSIYSFVGGTEQDLVFADYAGYVSVIPEQGPEVLYSGICGENLTWTLDENGLLSISGTGAMNNYTSNESPWAQYKAQISQICIAPGVTSIGDYAFREHDGFNDITIPGSVEIIGKHAFEECSDLDVVLLENGIKTIDDSAFSCCFDLGGISIPASVKTIGECAFAGCVDLRHIVLREGLAHIGNNAFAITDLWEISIPNSVTYIGDDAFGDISNLAYNTYGNARYLGNANNPYLLLWQADSSSITSCEIHPDTKFIHSDAFYGCENLQSITIPGSVTSVGARAFSHCKGLQSTEIANGVTEIRDAAFRCCSNLQSITIPSSLTEISSGMFHECSSLQSITIPDSVAAIGAMAFDTCSDLQTVVYLGTRTKWEQVEINTSYNAPLLNATVLCTGDIKFAGAALELQNNLAIRYRVKSSLFTEGNFTDPYVVFTLDGQETVISEYTVSGNDYLFTFSNIAPNQMNDNIKAVLYVSFGGIEYSSAPRNYSVATYCYTQLGKYADNAYAELRTLLVNLLNYGAVSQQFTGHNTDNLVNAALTEIQKGWATQSDRTYNNVQTTKYTTIENPTVSWKGGSLVLTDAVVMRLRFATDNTEGLSFKVTSGGSTWWINEFSTEAGLTYIYFNGLNAGQMSDEVFITAYQNGATVSNTVRYSIESYASQKITDTETPYLSEIVDAMMKYGDSAYAYVH